MFKGKGLFKALTFRIVITLFLLIPPHIYAAGFTDSHDDGDVLNNPSGSNWTNQGIRAWSESAGLISVQDMSNDEGHLINDYNCTEDGTFEVVLKSNDNWNSYYGGIVLRWTSTSSYYFVSILQGDNINNNGFIYWGENGIPGTQQGTGFNIPPTCTLKVVCTDSTFDIYVNSVLRLTKEDASHPSGKVGYGYPWQWDGKYLNWLECRWSDAGGSAPTITTQPLSDTVMVGNPASLLVTATGIPIPGYQWQTDTSGTWEIISGAADSTYTILSAALTHTGNYRAIASNASGTDTSQEAYIMVYESIVIIEQPQNDTVFTGDTATFGIIATGAPSLTYQWQSDKSGSWQNIPGANSTIYSFAADSGDNGVNFRCIVSILSIDSATSNAASLTVRKVYNPFKLTVECADVFTTNNVLVKIWSDEDLSDFPTTDQGSGPWSDYLWLVYSSNDYASDTTGSSIKLYSTEDIKQAAPDSLNPFEDTLTVGMLPIPNDSTWYFSYTVTWHNQGQPGTLLKPFKNDGSVYAIDTTAPPNILVVHGEYAMKTDTALIVIDSITKLSAANDSIAVIQVSEYSDFSILKLDTSLNVSELQQADRDTVIMDSIAQLPILKDTLYLRWYIVGKNQKTSPMLDTAFTIGWDRLVYSGSLTADSIAGQGDLIKLSWDAPQAGADSVRIWWNTSPIPLSHDPGLPVNQAFYPAPGTTIDTLCGLNPSSVYYFGLQIFGDDFWSVITPASSDTMPTAAGDTTTIPNVIKIDSSRFDTDRNTILLYWHIDFSLLPPEKGYKSGYTKTLESSLDTTIKPISWDTVGQEYNKTEISLVPDIVFDTAYTVGLWLRGISLEGKPGKPSYPTDSSTAKIEIPVFTWQVIDLFSPSSDTINAVNGKVIIIKQDVSVNITDTLWNYSNLPSPLPEGFMDVGSICFTFNPMEKDPPPFKLGLRYGTLPSGITESDLALYQYKANEFHVLYGSEVSNGAVFANVNKDNMPYPFVVLADTASPVVTPVSYNDTIKTGNDIPVWFSLNDNVANAQWELIYGPGNEGYSYGEAGSLMQSNDTSTSHLASIKDTGTVISPLYGVRALLIANDGVSSDTANVSRCVESSNCESFDLVANEWAPVRTTKGLDDPALAKVFERSIDERNGWEYDIYKYRIYRWYNPEPGEKSLWLEYDESIKEEFDFIPGRLIWCKTADSLTLTFGMGVTTSLKEPYKIVLKPDNWTDFTLPFQFPVMLRDVLEATNPYYNSLEVYQWKKDSTGHSAHDIFIFAFDNIEDENDTLLSGQKNDGYTVYNHYATPVTLLIPPVSLPLSKYPAVEKRKPVKSSGSWDICLRWKDGQSGGPDFKNRVRCGYKEGDSETIYGTTPPTMGNVLVGFYDSGNNRVCYWALQQGLDKKGGVSFELCFRNYSNNTVKVEYFLDKLNALPDGFNALIFDPKTMKYEACTKDNISKLELSSKSDVMRVLAVGSENYFNNIMSGFLPMKLLKTFPNPFNGQVKIRYRVPFGIREVQLKLFNLQGKLLWEGTDRENVSAGEHVFHLNGNKVNTGNGPLPTGVYIIRLSARDFSGKTLYGGEMRVTCIK